MDESSNENITINTKEIRLKILSGEYKMSLKTGRSKVWNTFRDIETDSGVKIPGFMVCRQCLRIYKHHQKATSNLVKHRCHIRAQLKNKLNNRKTFKTKINVTSNENITINTNKIKLKVLSGEYKMSLKEERPSKVWSIYGKIETDSGVEVPGFLICRKCSKIFKYNKKSTSNLVKHKCYIKAELKNKLNNRKTIETEIDETSNEDFAIDTNEIKFKILSGEYKVSLKGGRSKVWNIFGNIETDSGEEVPGFLICRQCSNIYKYNKKATSNLVKHKCYIKAELKNQYDFPKTVADNATKQIVVDIFTKWIVTNCRPFKVASDTGLKEIAEFFVSIGAKYGQNVDIMSFIPDPTIISQNVEAMYKVKFDEIKREISTIVDTGYGLTSDLWTDNFSRKTYIALTIHFVKDSVIHCRLLGMESMNNEKNTSHNVHAKVAKILKNFECTLDKRVIVVTDRESNMVSAFRSYNHLFCINHLLQNTIKKSLEDVEEIANICSISSIIVKYFKLSGKNSNFTTSLKSYSPTRWNTFYYVFVSIRNNWNEVIEILQEKDELDRLDKLKVSHLNGLIDILEEFEEALKVLEGEKNPTLHLVVVHIDKLLRTCAVKMDDINIIKLFKEKLLQYLNTIVLQNLNILHKVALFLFPPANKLFQFKDEEKEAIRKFTKDIMGEFCISSQSHNENSEILSKKNSELFGGFVSQQNLTNSLLKVDEELTIYENTIIHFHDNFEVFEWWNTNKNQFPLLYKTSCRVLAIPASSAASKRVFSAARSLLTEKRCTMDDNSETVSKIMFLNHN